jgi:hypothetical protein
VARLAPEVVDAARVDVLRPAGDARDAA